MTLPSMDISGRVGRLVAKLDAAGCDAVLITHLTNVRYLTGFTGSSAMMLVAQDRLILTTDGRYAQQAAEQLSSAGVAAEIVVGNLAAQHQALTAAGHGYGRVGLEASTVAWGRQLQLTKEVFASAEPVATDGLVEELRRKKDAGEVARIAEAARIADAALANVRPMLKGRPEEREIALELDFQMRRLGAAGNSFDTIVSSGPNAAMPHARPSDHRIRGGELVVIDFGAVVDGYCSDMTRTFSVGEPATAELRRMVEVVAESQQAGVATLRAGVGAREVDDACRSVIAAAGWSDAFVHSTGHGVGLDIHEYPLLGTTSTATVESGFVLTVEPGVYIRAVGGARIEDSLVVREDGCLALTNSPKDLVIE